MISHGSDLFLQNSNGLTACDLAAKAGYYELASYLEQQMVFVSYTFVFFFNQIYVCVYPSGWT